MSKKFNKFMWLEQEQANQQQPQPQQQQQPQPISGMNTPEQPQAMNQDPNQDPNTIPNDNPQAIPNEPISPEMPEDNEEVEFNTWRDGFFKLAVQNNTDKMLDAISEIEEQELTSPQIKFVEDNKQILLLRQDANFDKASKSVIKSIKTNIDEQRPGTTIMQVLSQEIDTNPILSEILIKLYGLHGLKGEVHRKYIAALTGSVQVGGGASTEDLVFNDKEFSINISTRITSDFGEINIGKWSLHEEDSSNFLAEPETERLQSGSPEEKKALVHRVVLESIAEKFKTRVFLIHVINNDGNVTSMGWDLGESLKEAYKTGQLIVKSDISSDSDVVINEAGDFIPLKNLGIYAVLDSNTSDENGKPEKKEVPFLENRSGVLYFVADQQTMESIGSGLPGINIQNKPFTGSKVEFNNLIHCIPSTTEIILRRC